MNIDWNGILKSLGAFAQKTLDDFLKDEKTSLAALGEKGVRFGKITSEALAKFIAGNFPKAEYDEINANIWNATKSELISKGYDEVARAGDVLQNSISFATSIISTILGGLKK